MNSKTFIKLIVSAIISILGVVGNVVSIANIDATYQISLGWLIMGGIAIVAVTLLFYNLYIKLPHNTDIKYPVVSFDNTAGEYYYIEYTESLRHNALVSFYKKINGRSRRIGFGVVNFISENEYIELEVLFSLKGFEQYLVYSNEDSLKDMYIMPIVYKENIETMYSELKRRERQDD